MIWHSEKRRATQLLEGSSRPGKLMEAFEDEHGTYIMNSKYLRAMQHEERPVQRGVHSLKIGGRSRSHFYVARTAQVPVPESVDLQQALVMREMEGSTTRGSQGSRSKAVSGWLA